jgi:hypothetical protein
LATRNEKNLIIKLIDFGFAKETNLGLETPWYLYFSITQSYSLVILKLFFLSFSHTVSRHIMLVSTFSILRQILF